MSLLTFLMKKAFRNPVNIMPFLLAFILLGNAYYQYYTVMKRDNALAPAPYTPSYSISILNGDLTLLEEDDPYIPVIREQIEKEKVRTPEEENWQSYDLHQIAALKQSIRREAAVFGEESEIIPIMRRQIAYWDYMYRNDLPYEPYASYTNGIAFLCFVFDNILMPAVFAGMAYIIAGVFCSFHTDRIDQTILLPVHAGTKTVSEISFSMIAGILTSATVICFGFSMGCIFDGSGTIMRGIEVFNQDVQYVSLRSLLPQLFIITGCGLFFCTGLIRTVCIFISDAMTALGTSVVLLVGLCRLPDGFAVIADQAHWIPMTYLRPFAAVTGQLADRLKNGSVSLDKGIIILFAAGMALWIVSMISEHRRGGMK